MYNIGNMKRFALFILAIFAFFASSNSIFAQVFPDDYVSRVWTAADGLPGNTITDIIQDHNGYIYIGTYEGLVRFDGIDFEIMNRNTVEGFGVLAVRSIYEDNKGNLWVGSNDEGLARISPDGIKMFDVKNGLPNNSVRDIIEDHDGNIWIGTADGVVYIDKDENICCPQGLENFDAEHILVQALYCDTAGRVWIVSTKIGGVFYYSAGRYYKYEASPYITQNEVTAIGQDSTGAFWFGISFGGAVRIDNSNVQLFDEGTAVAGAYLNDIILDKNGYLWICTEEGVFLYRDGKFHPYTEANGLTNNHVYRVLEDRESNLWFATGRGGVEKLSVGKFRTVNLNTTVNAIAQDTEQFVWLGTDSGLLCVDQNQNLVENDLTRLCKGLRVRHVAVCKNGDILISCYSEMGQIRAGKDGLQNWTTAEGLAGERVRVAIETSTGDLYVGTTTGLSIIHPDGTIKNFTVQEGLPNDYIMCIYEDNKGAVWVGSDGGGICVLKDEQITDIFNSDSGLAGNVIFKISQAPGGDYLFCTGGGVTRYDRNYMINYTSSCGLGTDSIFQMLFDYTDKVLMTSNRGVSIVEAQKLDSVKYSTSNMLDPKFFNRNDGLRTGGITSTSLSMIDNYGRIWITLIDGYAIYDPVKLKNQDSLPLMTIESIKFGEQTIKAPEKLIEIPAGVKRIDIAYTGLSFVSPEKMRFRYKLDGFDDGYSAASSARMVSYTNLKPGTYAFRVIASNDDENWSEMPASVSFIQLPFFWQRPAFWCMVCAIVVFALFIIVRIREKRMLKVQRQLEKMVKQRTMELEQEKNKSESLLLNILPTQIADRLKNNEDNTIADRFDEATVLFSDIVGFTTISSNFSAQEIVAALNGLFSRFDERAQASGIEKIKTIGDAYMAVCGVPVPKKDHALRMINFARGMYKDLQDYNATAAIKFSIRIGLNSGPVVAGVIGQSKFIYDLWGDTVNVASRMESICQPGRIMCAESVFERTNNIVQFEEGSQHEVKGKGLMQTYMVAD